MKNLKKTIHNSKGQNTKWFGSNTDIDDLIKAKEKTKELAGEVKNLEKLRKALLNVAEDANAKSKELAEAKAKDEAILTSIAEGCIAVNENGEIFLINKMAQKMLGYTSKESVGKQWHEILHREDEGGNLISPEKGAIRAALSSSTSSSSTTSFYYLRKDGTKFPISRTVSPITLQGKIIGAVNIFRDVTREKELEKLRMDFLSLASHQLRTPLSGTKWLIETMNSGITGKMTKKQKEYLNDIYKINEQMIGLVSDMLNVLRLESGVVSIKEEVISLSKLYDDILNMEKFAVKQKGWVVPRNLLKNKKDISVKTDVQILQKILDCFASNAINYSLPGREVILDAKEEAAAVVLLVKDNGIGIPKDEQKQILERFYRASNAKEFKPGGTGLGLHIASMLAKKIGGKIFFKSKENKGTTFYLRLPKPLSARR